MSPTILPLSLCCVSRRAVVSRRRRRGMIQRLHGRCAVGHVPLSRLDDGQVAEMVLACVADASDETVSRVQRAADGVPFLAEEVLAAPGLPGSFRESVRTRLSALAGEERLLLEAAAVLGCRFDWRLLGQVTGHSLELVARALKRGVGDLLLTVTPGEFGFRYALTRDAVLGNDAAAAPHRAVCRRAGDG
jgi:hypothetical protein